MKNRSFTVVIYKEDDAYIAECPEVGTVDQGKTIEEAALGLREATKLYLEEFLYKFNVGLKTHASCTLRRRLLGKKLLTQNAPYEARPTNKYPVGILYFYTTLTI